MKAYALFGIFVAAIVLFFALYLIFGRLHYKKKTNGQRYDYLTMFPFEMSEGESPFMPATRIFLALFQIATVLGSIYLIYLFPSFNYMIGIVIIYGVSCLLKAGGSLMMNFAPAYAGKPHLLSFVGYLAAFALSEALAGICFLNLRGFSSPLALTFTIISFILTLCGMLFAANPRMSKWANLKSTMEQDGSITTSRPRPFVLAASEWGLTLLDLLGILTSVIGFFVIAIISAQ